jgi:hypothetical protein
MFNQVEASYVGRDLAKQMDRAQFRAGVGLATLRGIRLLTGPANPPAKRRSEFR